MDPDFFVKISPGINAIKTVVPDQRFIVSLGLPMGPQAIEGVIVWHECVAGQKLRFSCSVPFALAPVEVQGTFLFSGEEACQIDYSAEIDNLPPTLPPPMVHGIATQHIHSFFTNLKAETEAAHRRQLSD